jgi:hypothetical protein
MSTKINKEKVIYKEMQPNFFICYFCELPMYQDLGYIGFQNEHIVHPMSCQDCKIKMENE